MCTGSGNLFSGLKPAARQLQNFCKHTKRLQFLVMFSFNFRSYPLSSIFQHPFFQTTIIFFMFRLPSVRPESTLNCRALYTCRLCSRSFMNLSLTLSILRTSNVHKTQSPFSENHIFMTNRADFLDFRIIDKSCIFLI